MLVFECHLPKYTVTFIKTFNNQPPGIIVI